MVPNWLSLIDIAFVVAALLFAWGGFQKGFAGQVAHVLTFLTMGVLLFFAYPYIYGYLGRVFRNIDEAYIMWALMVGLVVLAVFIFALISKLLVKLLKTQISERSDHVYGLVLGLVRGALAALLAMIFLVMLGPSRIEDSFLRKSFTGKFVCRQLVPRIRPHLSRRVWSEDVQKLEQKIYEKRKETNRSRTGEI